MKAITESKILFWHQESLTIAREFNIRLTMLLLILRKLVIMILSLGLLMVGTEEVRLHME